MQEKIKQTSGANSEIERFLTLNGRMYSFSKLKRLVIVTCQ